MAKEKIFPFIKKAFIYIFKGVIIGISIALMFVIACVYISVLSKAVDIAYNDDGKFADLVDEIADIFSDDNNSSRVTKDIVANAQFEALGETYVDIPIDSYNFVASESALFLNTSSFSYVEFLSFVPRSGVLYFIVLDTVSYDSTYKLYSYFYPINSYDKVYLAPSDITCDSVGASSFSSVDNSLVDMSAYPYNIVYDYLNEEFWLIFFDGPGTFEPGVSFTISIYEVPSSDISNCTIDNIGSIIASGMTFGLDGITSSVSTAFDSVFLDNDGNLSNYSIFVFWALGVSVALGFFKYILDWILSLGSRK